MVKGVNKSVIEINCTDNGYFERAILFVNPEYSYLSGKRITAEAEKFAKSLDESIVISECGREKENSRTERTKRIIISLLVTTAVITLALLIFNKL